MVPSDVAVEGQLTRVWSLSDPLSARSQAMLVVPQKKLERYE